MYIFINKILNFFKKKQNIEENKEDLLEILIYLNTDEILTINTNRGYKNIKSSLKKILAILALQNKSIHKIGVNIATINSREELDIFNNICQELEIR